MIVASARRNVKTSTEADSKSFLSCVSVSSCCLGRQTNTNNFFRMFIYVQAQQEV